MGRLPGEPVGELRKVVPGPVGVFAFAQDRLVGQSPGSGGGGAGQGGRGDTGDEAAGQTAAGDGGRHGAVPWPFRARRGGSNTTTWHGR